MPSNIAWQIRGTPARMWTFSTLKPGALDTGLSIRSAPSGVFAILRRASFNSMPVRW